MLTPLGIALLGCGTVGRAVVKLLSENQSLYEGRVGRGLELRAIVVQDVNKTRLIEKTQVGFTSDINQAIQDPAVHVVVELMGGTTAARHAVLAALAAGKDVVTANKALIAEHGDEIFAVAHQFGRTVTFEAAVGGGIPIISTITQGLIANRITGLRGILNGTCNFILSEMTQNGRKFADALAEAQRSGYAETDPSLDVNGTDTAQKLAILARVAFGVAITPNRIPTTGIENIGLHEIRRAQEQGCVIKLIASAVLEAKKLKLSVGPADILRGMPLADVNGAFNAIHVVGDAVGDSVYYGLGAGGLPTASAVVSDLIDLAIGRAQLTFHAQRLWETNQDIRITSSSA